MRYYTLENLEGIFVSRHELKGTPSEAHLKYFVYSAHKKKIQERS